MNYTQLFDDLSRIFAQFKQSVFQFLPNLIGALVIFFLGLLLARLSRALLDRFITNLDRLITNRTLQSRLQPFIKDKPVPKILSGITYWILVFFFLTVATETLGLPVVTAWMSGIASYLPKILAAALIGCAGLIGSFIVRDLVLTAAASAGLVHGDLLGRLTQIAVLLVTVLIGIEQMDIDVTFLTTVITIALGALLFGAALAFGLGARTSVSNILASYYLQQTYAAGQRVRVGDLQGRILQITSIAVILETPEGQLYVPAKAFGEIASMLLTEEM